MFWCGITKRHQVFDSYITWSNMAVLETLKGHWFYWTSRLDCVNFNFTLYWSLGWWNTQSFKARLSYDIGYTIIKSASWTTTQFRHFWCILQRNLVQFSSTTKWWSHQSSFVPTSNSVNVIARIALMLTFAGQKGTLSRNRSNTYCQGFMSA